MPAGNRDFVRISSKYKVSESDYLSVFSLHNPNYTGSYFTVDIICSGGIFQNGGKNLR